jgi:hypothetical protein
MSEEHTASIIRDKVRNFWEECGLWKMDQATRIGHSQPWLSSALMMEVVFSSETLAHSQNTTQRNNPEDRPYLEKKLNCN